MPLSATVPVNTFSHHCRQQYGEPIGKLPLDVGQECPNRRVGGCIFCRPASFTPGFLFHAGDIVNQIEQGKKALAQNRFRRYFAYFQQETCTALAPSELLRWFAVPLADPDCLGLIISTRPDHVADELLAVLAPMIRSSGKECLFEIGMQSVHDRSLTRLNRNHSFRDVEDAIHRIKKCGPFSIGVHLLFGIPGETEDDMLDSVTRAVLLGIDALKLHHLQVIRGTTLEALYEQGEFTPFTLQGYMRLLVRLLPHIPEHVVIHRLWATSHPQLLVAPRWNILTTRLRHELNSLLKSEGVTQGNLLSQSHS